MTDDCHDCHLPYEEEDTTKFTLHCNDEYAGYHTFYVCRACLGGRLRVIS